MRDHLTLSPRWYVLTVAPGKEREAVDVLNRRGFEAQRPVETIWRRHGRKRKRTEIGTTPRYIFHKCNGWPQFYRLSEIYSRTGDKLITGYLSVDGLPYPVPDQVVDALMSTSTEGLPNIHRSIRAGDMVQIPELHNAVGRMLDATDNLARVSIEMLGSLREVTIQIQKLEAA